MATKAPQDRKPKAGEPHRVEVDGRTWTVDSDALDDFELLDDLGEIEAGNAARLPRALRRLLGAEQYKRAIESLRDGDTGRVPVEAGAEFIKAVFEGLPQGNG